MRSFKKRVLVFFVIASMVVPMNAYGQAIKEKREKDNAFDTIEEFITVLENDQLSSEEAYSYIEELSSENSIDNIYSGNDSYLAMVKLILERRELVYSYSKADLHEYNKTINYDYTDIYTSQDFIKVKVDVLKEWNYKKTYL